MSGVFTANHVDARPWLATLDPRLKLCWVLSISLVAIVVDQMPALAALGAIACLPLVGLRMTLAAWTALISLVGLTIWTTMLSQGLFYTMEPRTPLIEFVPSFELAGISFGGLRLYREGMSYGLLQSLRFVAGAIAGVSVVLCTSPERLLAALVWLRVPGAVAFVTVSALRSLPLLVDEWLTIRQARRVRTSQRAGWFTSLKDELSALAPLLAISLRRAGVLAQSVSARGFRPGAPRTFYPPLRMTLIEMSVVTLLGLSCSIVATVKTLEWLTMANVVQFSALRGWL